MHVRGSGRRERPAARLGRVLVFFFFESASLCSSHPGLSLSSIPGCDLDTCPGCGRPLPAAFLRVHGSEKEEGRCEAKMKRPGWVSFVR